MNPTLADRRNLPADAPRHRPPRESAEPGPACRHVATHSRRAALRAAFLSVLVAAFPARPGSAQAEPLRVIATLPSLAAIVQEVGGSHVTVRALALPTQDPHFVDAKPNLALELNRARLVVLIGLDLEVGWLPTLLTGARNSAIQPGASGHLDASQFVRVLDVPNAPVDRSAGDIHPRGNPHYLNDPRAAAAIARGVAERLAVLDPERRDVYQGNLRAFLARLETARRRWEERLAPLRGATVITYHRTLVYLSDWLGLRNVGFLEPKAGTPPSPRHIAGLLELGRREKLRAVLQESYYPDKVSRLVAEKIPAPLVVLPGGSNVAAGQGYIAYMDELIASMARALSGGR